MIKFLKMAGLIILETATMIFCLGGIIFACAFFVQSIHSYFDATYIKAVSETAIGLAFWKLQDDMGKGFDCLHYKFSKLKHDEEQ